MKPNFFIALQYHPGDSGAAARLIQLIASLEGSQREDVGFLVVRRFDAEYIPDAVIYQLTRKFFIEHFQTKTKQLGWPDGCNAMARDTLDEINLRSKQRPHWAEVNGVFLMEPDCIPISRNWLYTLILEWKLARAMEKWIMGTWRDGGGTDGHINGNMVVRPDLAEVIDLTILPGGVAWDCSLTPQVKSHWMDTRAICNRWNETGVSPEAIKAHRNGPGPSPVLVHGVKDDSVWKYVSQIA